ncbi:hypothetical protein [Kitasatospora sp. NPDC002040]|uniref:hypothetical protein n=1 Tax=Kitasatospora sp. NPDC002040 TaxID=3154661 RepID=UPI00332EC80F
MTTGTAESAGAGAVVRTGLRGARDPYAVYRWLRSEHPVCFDPELGLWLVSRYADVDQVLRDVDTFGNAGTLEPMWPMDPEAVRVLGESGTVPVASTTDPPEHARLRAGMTAAWPTTPRRVAAHEAMLSGHVAAAVAAFAARPAGRGDLVADLAGPLSARVFTALCGIPLSHHARIAAAARGLTGLVWDRQPAQVQRHTAAELTWLNEFCSEVIADRARTPSKDVAGALVAWRGPGGEHLTGQEAASQLAELLITNAEVMPLHLANTCYHLLRTGHFTGLAARPDRVPAVCAEALRHCTAVTGWLKSTRREARLAGVTIPAGQQLLLLLGSASRDEATGLADPDTLDPDRRDAPAPLAFSVGIHHCPAAAFSRRLAELLVAALAQALPGLRLEEADEGAWARTDLGIHGPERVSVSW